MFIEAYYLMASLIKNCSHGWEEYCMMMLEVFISYMITTFIAVNKNFEFINCLHDNNEKKRIDSVI